MNNFTKAPWQTSKPQEGATFTKAPWESQTAVQRNEARNEAFNRNLQDQYDSFMDNPELNGDRLGLISKYDDHERYKQWQSDVYARGDKSAVTLPDDIRSRMEDPRYRFVQAYQQAEARGWEDPGEIDDKEFSDFQAGVMGAGNELWFGGFGEVNAAVNAAFDRSNGDSFGERYERNFNVLEGANELMKEENTGAHTTGSALGFLGTMGVPVGFAAKGGRLAKVADKARDGKVVSAASEIGKDVFKTAATGAGIGAGFSGLYSFNSTDSSLDERWTAAKEGALWGGVVGAPVQGAFRYALVPGVQAGAYKMFTSAEDKALDAILVRAQRSGTDLDQVKTQFQNWRKTDVVPETLGELMGPHERELLQAVIVTNKAVREKAEDVLTGRGRNEVDWLEGMFERSLSRKRGDYRATRAAARKARAEDPEQLYAQAHYSNTGDLSILPDKAQVGLNRIFTKMRNPGPIFGAAADDLNKAGNYKAEAQIDAYAKALAAGKKTPRLSIQAADYLDRAIGAFRKQAAMGATDGVSASTQSWRKTQENVRKFIDTQTGLKEAREMARDRIRQTELIMEGRKFLKPSTDPEDITDVMTGDPDLGIPAASEGGREAYVAGAARAIGDDLRNVPDMKGFADASRKVARTPAIREKIDAILPKRLRKDGREDRRTSQTRRNEDLRQGIERVGDRATYSNDMVGNSKTAFRQGAVDSAKLDTGMAATMGQAAGDLMLGGPLMAAAGIHQKAARAVGDRIARPGIFNDEFAGKVGEILLSTGDDIPKALEALEARIAKKMSMPKAAPGQTGPVVQNGLPFGSLAQTPALAGGAAGGAAGFYGADNENMMPLTDRDGSGSISQKERLQSALAGAAAGAGAAKMGRLGFLAVDDRLRFKPGKVPTFADWQEKRYGDVIDNRSIREAGREAQENQLPFSTPRAGAADGRAARQAEREERRSRRAIYDRKQPTQAEIEDFEVARLESEGWTDNGSGVMRRTNEETDFDLDAPLYRVADEKSGVATLEWDDGLTHLPGIQKPINSPGIRATDQEARGWMWMAGTPEEAAQRAGGLKKGRKMLEAVTKKGEEGIVKAAPGMKSDEIEGLVQAAFEGGAPMVRLEIPQHKIGDRLVKGYSVFVVKKKDLRAADSDFEIHQNGLIPEGNIFPVAAGAYGFANPQDVPGTSEGIDMTDRLAYAGMLAGGSKLMQMGGRRPPPGGGGDDIVSNGVSGSSLSKMLPQGKALQPNEIPTDVQAAMSKADAIPPAPAPAQSTGSTGLRSKLAATALGAGALSAGLTDQEASMVTDASVPKREIDTLLDNQPDPVDATGIVDYLRNGERRSKFANLTSGTLPVSKPKGSTTPVEGQLNAFVKDLSRSDLPWTTMRDKVDAWLVERGLPVEMNPLRGDARENYFRSRLTDERFGEVAQ